MRTRRSSIPARLLKTQQQALVELARSRRVALLLTLLLMGPMAVSARPTAAAHATNEEATTPRRPTLATLEACVDQVIDMGGEGRRDQAIIVLVDEEGEIHEVPARLLPKGITEGTCLHKGRPSTALTKRRRDEASTLIEFLQNTPARRPSRDGLRSLDTEVL
jgi:DNA topoisomerase VI subunit B